MREGMEGKMEEGGGGKGKEEENIINLLYKAGQGLCISRE